MTGADRFQFFLDASTRRITGCGNVVRAFITVDGIIPENDLTSSILSNKAIRFLAAIYPHRRWFSSKYSWNKNPNVNFSSVLKIFENGNFDKQLSDVLQTDCSFENGNAIQIAVLYNQNKTNLIISANHTLLDYAGMELLIKSISGNGDDFIFEKKWRSGSSFLEKFIDTIEATFFVAARSSWNVRRLLTNKNKSELCYEAIVLSADDYKSIQEKLFTKIKTPALPFYLAVVISALSKHNDLLTNETGDFFIAVPIDRRMSGYRNVLLSNFISFIYFHKKSGEKISVEETSQEFSSQMIYQARKRIPEKFESLMELFSFLPTFIYNAWLNLPSKGNTSSFAFSLLSPSGMENKSFLNYPVSDITHFAPVISPPGLNIIFTTFQNQLKIIISFDCKRIEKQQVDILVQDIRKNLLD